MPSRSDSDNPSYPIGGYVHRLSSKVILDRLVHLYIDTRAAKVYLLLSDYTVESTKAKRGQSQRWRNGLGELRPLGNSSLAFKKDNDHD